MLSAARTSAFASVVCLALSSVALADVLIVEAPELGAFFDPQRAVELAPEGATLVFGQEPTPGFVIDGKSLTLVGPGPEMVNVAGTVVIRNLGENQSVRLQNLWVEGLGTNTTFEPAEIGMLIEDCAGAVRLSGCQVDGGDGMYDLYFEEYPDGNDALIIRQSSDVALLDCRIEGGTGAGLSNSICCEGGAGAQGLIVEGSEIALYDCTLRGGAGGLAGFFGGDGGFGVQTTDTRFFASGCQFTGGNGANSVDFLVSFGGDGGNGLTATGLPRPRFLDSSFQGGLGGFGLDGNGVPGVGRAWDLGGLPLIPGAHRGMRLAEHLVLTGDSYSLELEGLMGDRFFLTASLRDARAQTFSPPGVRLVPVPALLPTTPQATLGADGTTRLTLPGLGIPLGTNSASWMVQAFVKDAAGETHIAGASLVTMLRTSAQPDCLGSGVWDVYEAMTAIGVDCDGNLELDVCQTLPDCNSNGFADGLETSCLGLADDINGNSIPDECEVGQVLYVDPQAGLGGDGTIASPFGSLSRAFDLALSGATIRLFDGMFSGPDNRGLQTQGRTLILESLGGPNACLIDLEDEGNLLFCFGDGTPSSVEMRGLSVTGGAGFQGGAVQVAGQDALFENCVFRENNTASGSGGALYLDAGAFVLRDCQFQDNSTPAGEPFARTGGAVFSRGSLVVERCVFDRNVSDLGGALRITTTSAYAATPSRITHSIFRTNEALRRGGAIQTPTNVGDAQGVSLVVDNSFFGFNSALEAGGVLYAIGNPSTAVESLNRFTSCTLVENTAGSGVDSDSGGGALYLGPGAGAQVLGSVLWGNAAALGSQIRGVGSALLPASIVVQASTVQGGAAGFALLNGSTANFSSDSLTSDPLFMNPPADFRLGAGSPCIDSMNVALLNLDFGDIDGDGDTLERVPLDLLGAARRVDDPGAPDVGTGSAPLPDMGAFERQP